MAGGGEIGGGERAGHRRVRRWNRGVVGFGIYAAARLLALPLQCMPLRAALWLARRVGSLGYFVLGRRRRIALHNLEQVFGDGMSERERRRFAKLAFQNLTMVAIESLHLPRLVRSGKLRKLVEPPDTAELTRNEVAKGPVLFVSAHLGAWELGTAAINESGVSVVVVARVLENPWFDAWLRKLRAGSQQLYVESGGAFRQIQRAVRAGKSIALLLDQNSRHGIFVDFLGRPAKTAAIAGILSQRYHTTLIMGWTERIIPGRKYKLHLDPPLHLSLEGTASERIHAATQICTNSLEQFVRTAPRQWFWLHQRWKDRPDGTREKIY